MNNTTTDLPEEDDDQELVNEWASYLDNTHVINNCRIFLINLWNHQFPPKP